MVFASLQAASRSGGRQGTCCTLCSCGLVARRTAAACGVRADTVYIITRQPGCQVIVFPRVRGSLVVATSGGCGGDTAWRLRSRSRFPRNEKVNEGIRRFGEPHISAQAFSCAGASSPSSSRRRCTCCGCTCCASRPRVSAMSTPRHRTAPGRWARGPASWSATKTVPAGSGGQSASFSFTTCSTKWTTPVPPSQEQRPHS